VERLDLVNLRLVDTEAGTAIALEDQLGELEALRWEGKLDLIGLSNVDRPSVERALHLVDVAENHGATPAQIALAWLLARYERMLLIPGTRSLAHLEENMAAIEVDLDDTHVAALDRAGGRPGTQ
jgi:aryl-alcohol dehydrogenase-like predicted oxidoreductase